MTKRRYFLEVTGLLFYIFLIPLVAAWLLGFFVNDASNIPLYFIFMLIAEIIFINTIETKDYTQTGDRNDGNERRT